MRSAFFVFALLVPCACTHPAGSATDSPPPATASEAPATPVVEARAKGPVIATIATHDAKVSILGRGGDLRVIVRKTDGAVVADGISLDELRSTDPNLHAIVTSAVASNGTYLDATLDAPVARAAARAR